jgi:hypothetical protein
LGGKILKGEGKKENVKETVRKGKEKEIMGSKKVK